MLTIKDIIPEKSELFILIYLTNVKRCVHDLTKKKKQTKKQKKKQKNKKPNNKEENTPKTPQRLLSNKKEISYHSSYREV